MSQEMKNFLYMYLIKFKVYLLRNFNERNIQFGLSNALGVLCKNLRESNGVIKFCDEVLINFVKNKINIIFLVGNWYWETFFSMPVLLYMYTVMSQVAARILKSKDFNFK